MNRAKKRIFFLTQENLERVRTNPKIGLKNKDIIIITDEGYIGKEKSFDSYLKTQAKKKNQNVIGYNIRWTQRWAFQKLGNNRNNKSFAEELEFDKSSLWYFIDFLLHRFPDLKDFSLSKILIHIDALNKIIKKYNPSEIIVENFHGTLNKLIVKICKKNNIRIRSLNLKNKDFKLKQTLRESIFLTKTYLKLRIFLRKIIASTFCKKLSREEVLILTSTRLSNEENSTDYFWGPLIKELDKRGVSYKVVEYDQIQSPESIKRIFNRYIPQKYDAQFVGTYYDSKTSRLSKEVASFLRKKFLKLDKRNDFKSSFTYKGINFYDLIRTRLKKIFLAYTPYIGDVYAMGKAIIRQEKPELVLIDHEKNYYGKSLLIEANKKKVYSISMEGEMAYSSKTKLVQEPLKGVLERKNPLWRPIADKKLISGGFSEKWHKEKFLVPAQNLKVIGSPKYDFLRKLTPEDKKNLLNNYGARQDEKLVVVITCETPMEASYLEAVLKVLKGKNVYVVIKQHPEHASESTKNRMEKIMKRDHIKGCVRRSGNTSVLLYSADLVVTVNSTIINECIFMDKRTILFEPRSDLSMPWVDEGIIRACTSTAELERKIKDSFSMKSLFDKEKRKNYIKRYFFSDDGKASKRAVDEIQSHIK